MNLFSFEVGRKDVSKDIASHMLGAHLFLVIPIIGPFIKYMMFAFYLFGGLRFNLGMNYMQCAFVLCFPFLIFCFFVFLLVFVFLSLLF